MRARAAAAIGVLAAAVLVGDGAAALHLRAQEQQERREAAARAAAAADQAWFADVTSVHGRVGAAVAPLLEADSDVVTALGTGAEETPASGLAVAVLQDVVLRGATLADLDAVRTELDAVVPPAPRAERHAALRDRLADVRADVAALTDADGAAVLQGLFALESSAQAFDTAVRSTEVDGASVPLAPTVAQLPAEALGRGGLLLRLGRVCAAGSLALVDAPDLEQLFEDGRFEPAAAELERQAESLRTAVTALLEVPVPPADAERLERDVRAPLRGVAPAADSLRGLAAAARSRDVAALEREALALDQTLGSFEAASQGMAALGSSTCAAYLDAGVLLGDDAGGGPPDDTTST